MMAAGARSPPMASTATGSTAAPPLLNVQCLPAAVPAAIGADDVRQLGLPALRAHAAGRRRQRPVRRPPAAAFRLRGLLLGNGHVGVLRSAVVGAQRIEP